MTMYEHTHRMKRDLWGAWRSKLLLRPVELESSTYTHFTWENQGVWRKDAGHAERMWMNGAIAVHYARI